MGRAWIAVAGIVAAVVATPAAGQWSNTGPFGGSVGDIAINPRNPQVVYALTSHAGVFKSTNGGRTWARANTGLPADKIGYGLEISPANPSYLYLELEAVLYRSTDGAATWTKTPGQIHEGSRDMDLHPTDPNTLYLTRFREVVVSTDGGATFTPLPIEQHHPWLLAVAPSAPRTLYGHHGRVHVSRDAGVTWKEGNDSINMETFLVDQESPETVYAAGTDGLLKSTNGGKTFTWIDPWHQLADPLRHLAVVPTTPRTLYVGTWYSELYRSTDGGASWIQTALPPLNGISALAVDPLDPESAIVSSRERGLVRTADGGATWAPSHQGLVAADLRNIAASPVVAGTVLAGSDWGVYRTTDGGRSWAFSGLAGRSQEAFAFTPRNRNLVFAAGTDGIFRSGDGGRTWRLRVAPPEDHQWGWGVAIAPSNQRVVYAGTTDGTIWRSLDSGFTWQPRSRPISFDGSIAVDPTRPQILWVGTQQNGLRRSLDGGRTWRELLDEYAGEYHTAMDPVVIDPLRPKTVYVGWGRTVWRTTDNGATWRPWLEGVAASTFAVDRAHPRTFFVQRLDGRILRTVNSGATWAVLAGELPTTETNDVTISADGKTLFASSWGGGVFSRRVR